MDICKRLEEVINRAEKMHACGDKSTEDLMVLHNKVARATKLNYESGLICEECAERCYEVIAEFEKFITSQSN